MTTIETLRSLLAEAVELLQHNRSAKDWSARATAALSRGRGRKRNIDPQEVRRLAKEIGTTAAAKELGCSRQFVHRVVSSVE